MTEMAKVLDTDEVPECGDDACWHPDTMKFCATCFVKIKICKANSISFDRTAESSDVEVDESVASCNVAANIRSVEKTVECRKE